MSPKFYESRLVYIIHSDVIRNVAELHLGRSLTPGEIARLPEYFNENVVFNALIRFALIAAIEASTDEKHVF